MSRKKVDFVKLFEYMEQGGGGKFENIKEHLYD